MKISHFVFALISVILILNQSAFIKKADLCDNTEIAVETIAPVFDYSEFVENPVRTSLEFEKLSDKNESDYITAGEAVVIVSRLYAYLNGGHFDDAYYDDPYDKYYLFAENCGIIKKGEFYFDDRNITRAEFAYLIYPLCKKEAEINEIYFLPDVFKGTLYCEEIFSMYRIGLTDGMDVYGAFMPDLPVNALQFNTFIKRYLDVSQRLQFTFPPQNACFVNEFDALLQNPELPTGCEVTSLASLLCHFGFDVDKTELADSYLPKGEIGLTSPETAFVGDPKSSESYGCFAPVIVKCANSYLEIIDADCKAYNTTGASLDSLFCEIEKSNPVLVWTTMFLAESFVSKVWNINGTDIPWLANEHCVVLTGFDKNEGVVYVMDPLRGNVKYNLELFNKRYEELGKQSVIIK